MHKDSIVVDTTDDSPKHVDVGKLRVIPFEGVAPKMYPRIFMSSGRKESGVRKNIDLNKAKPIIEKFLYSTIEFEAVVAAFVKEEQEMKKSS